MGDWIHVSRGPARDRFTIFTVKRQYARAGISLYLSYISVFLSISQYIGPHSRTAVVPYSTADWFIYNYMILEVDLGACRGRSRGGSQVGASREGPEGPPAPTAGPPCTARTLIYHWLGPGNTNSPAG